MSTSISSLKRTVYLHATFCALLLMPVGASALQVSLETASTTIATGGVVPVSVLVDPEGESINAIEGVLDVVSTDPIPAIVNDSASVISLWVTYPSFEGTPTTVPFSGLIPGGFNGVIDSFSGERGSGTIFSLHFKPLKQGVFTLRLSGVKALLNDGQGTEVTASEKSLQITVLPREEHDAAEITETAASVPIADEEDTAPPRIIDVALVKERLLYDGQKTLIFRGSDGESGISHFEIQEGEGSWVVAESPYVLREQHQEKPIKLKVIDNAGNFTIETISGSIGKDFSMTEIVLAIGIGLLGVVWLSLRYYRRFYARG